MLSDPEFARLISFIENATGMTLPESNYRQVRTYLEETLVNLAMTLEGYLDLIRRDGKEYNRLMQVITINETYFFREEKQFRCLKEHHLPRLIGDAAKSPLQIWSSTCSSGEEALSLYSLLRSILEGRRDFHIFASDINEEMLLRFGRGIYRPASFRGDGAGFHSLIREIAVIKPDQTWRIREEHLNAITRERLNLFCDSLDHLPPIDIIFLRNTLIYMSQANKKIILDRVVGKLRVGGILFLSSVELPLIAHPSLVIEEAEQTYFLRKIDPQALSPLGLTGKLEAVLKRTGVAGFGGAEKPDRRPAAAVKRKLPEPESQKDRPLTEEAVCRLIQIRLNNGLPTEVSPELDRVAAEMMEIMLRLNDNRLEEAALLLATAPEGPASLTLFLTGYLAYLKQERSALSLFRACLRENPRMWPARYYLARTLAPEDPALPGELKTLAEHISAYITEHQYDYQFLLDGFNAQYFLMIAERMLTETERRAAPHGH